MHQTVVFCIPSNRVAGRLREGRLWIDNSGLGGSSVPPFRLRRGHNVAVIWLNATVGAGKSVVGRALADFLPAPGRGDEQ